jgi:hypothetical protein
MDNLLRNTVVAPIAESMAKTTAAAEGDIKDAILKFNTFDGCIETSDFDKLLGILNQGVDVEAEQYIVKFFMKLFKIEKIWGLIALSTAQFG